MAFQAVEVDSEESCMVFCHEEKNHDGPAGQNVSMLMMRHITAHGPLLLYGIAYFEVIDKYNKSLIMIR